MFEEALHHWKDGGTEIPVFLALQTPAGLKIAAKILSRIERVFGYVDCDGTGCDENDGERVRALLLFDEGDLVEKGTDTTEWAAVLKNKFGSCRKSKSFGSKTLLDVASSLAFVTATPQALVTTALRLDERAFIYCDLPVSKNYCGYGEGLDQPVGFKTICRRTLPEEDETGRGVRQQFYDYVATSDKPIAGMVYTNEAKASKIKSGIEEARETAVNYSKVTRFPICSWSAGQLDVFMSSPEIQEAIVLTGGFKNNEDHQGVVHYEGKGITDYPRFVTKVIEALRKVPPNNGFFKSILFGCEMVAQGVPVCGSNHQ